MYSTKGPRGLVLSLFFIIGALIFYQYRFDKITVNYIQNGSGRSAQFHEDSQCLSHLQSQNDKALPPMEYVTEATKQLSEVATVTNDAAKSASTETLTPNLPLPIEYAMPEVNNTWCQDRFDKDYLLNLRDSQFRLCGDEGAGSRVDCFAVAGDERRMDTFCYGQKAVFSRETQKLHLSCPGEFNKPFGEFPSHWGDVGVEYSMRSMDWNGLPPSNATCKGRPYNIVIVKRDGTANFWHTMMEIIAVSLSLDALRITRSSVINEPLFTDADIPRTQIVIADDHRNGPLLELWKMFSGLPVIRESEMASSPAFASGCPVNVLLPLPGGANPLWAGDWTDLPCTHSDLVTAWRHRVLGHFGVDSIAPPISPTLHNVPVAPSLTVTVLNRVGTRRIHNQDELMNKTQEALQGVNVQLVDLASMSLKEQLEIIEKTDILVGVHGAGLTHLIMMQQEKAVIEIQPSGMVGDGEHRGFRTVAKLRGQKYFKMKAEMIPKGEGDGDLDWHFLDVVVDHGTFLRALTSAIDSMSQYGIGDRVIE